MAISPTTTLPGSAQTGFTSPTFSLAPDLAPNGHSEQWVVYGKGGTQPSGVEVNSVSAPFTLTVQRPAQFRVAPIVPASGVMGNVPRNVYLVRTRKSVAPVSGQANQIMLIETKFSVPAGADVNDSDNVLAAYSAHFGLLEDQSSNLGQLAISGVL